MVRILVNGCSHTSADIPDNRQGDPWPRIFCDKIDAELISLAEQGKDNNWILEETIRYLINDDNINHVMVYFTDWKRLNIFRTKKSFTWIPGDLKTQLPRLNNAPNDPNTSVNFARLAYTIETRVPSGIIRFGDTSKMYERIYTGTLTNCLYQLCLSKNIGLTIINIDSLGDAKDDKVWSKIPNELFLFKNYHLSSTKHHFLGKYSMPDDGHFEHAFHYELADHVEAHYRNKTQIEGKTKKPKFDPVYNYTN